MSTPEYTSKQFQVYLDPHKAWEVIEYKSMGYDRDIDELYPESFLIEKKVLRYQEEIKSTLLPDEQYVLLEGKCDGYAITSFGRVLNVEYNNQCVVYFSPNRIQLTVRNIKIDFATEFMKYNWSFDINGIRQLYIKNKWNYQWNGKRFYQNK
jgi:hypothetical protein